MDETDLKAPQKVRCMPPVWVYLFALFGLACAVTMYFAQFTQGKQGHPPSPEWRGFCWAMGLIYGGSCLVPLFHALKVGVVADPEGLRWRSFWRGGRFVTWDQVSDYYDTGNRISQGGANASSPTIVTTEGIVAVPTVCTNLDALRRLVRERATSARVSDWELFGTRRVDDWPRTFWYWKPGTGRILAKQFVAPSVNYGLAALAFFQAGVYIASIPYVSNLPVVYGALAACYAALLMIPLSHLITAYQGWKRRSESIIVTPETVSYENTVTGEVREAAWSEISDYYFRPSSKELYHSYSLTLPGSDESQITWTGLLGDSRLLLAIVQKYAPIPLHARGNEDGWRDKSVHEKTGGSDPTTWKGGAVGIGGRVFAYRNADHLGMLSVFTITAGFFLLACFLLSSRSDASGVIVRIVGSLVFGAPTVWAWLAVIRNARIETDDMGITQYTVFGKKYLPWFAIEDYTGWVRSSASGGGTDIIRVSGRNGVRIAVWHTYNGFDELKGEIERFAPPPKTGWRG